MLCTTQASKHLTLIKKNTTKFSQEHLHARAEEANLVGNDDLSYYICRLIVIEHQVVIHKKIKNITASVTYNFITQLEVTKDSTIGWNNTQKDLPTNQWRTVTCNLKRNIEHLNQTQGTPCTVPLLYTLLGDDSFTIFGNEILSGSANLDKL